jgi:hypothetical protein
VPAKYTAPAERPSQIVLVPELENTGFHLAQRNDLEASCSAGVLLERDGDNQGVSAIQANAGCPNLGKLKTQQAGQQREPDRPSIARH